jgi:hypothetical protein
MRVLFVSASYGNYYAIDDVIRRMMSRGHDVRLVLGMDKKMNIPDDALQRARRDLPSLVFEPLRRRIFLRQFSRNIRELLNYAHVLNNEETRRWDAVKWSRFIPPFLWRIVSSPSGRKMLKSPRWQQFLRSVEQKIPVDIGIRNHIQRHQPDVVILLPLINPDSRENEYLRAAQSLGIPAVYSMASWDNIATKGTFHGLPDYSIVWNEPLALELALMHNVPRDRILFTGAPRFDRLTNGGTGEYMLERSEFCRLAGLDGKKEYVLYVCSTFLVNTEFKKELDESALILEIADALQKDPRTRDLNILVRPHPTNSGFVEAMLAHAKPNIIAYPANGEIPDTEEKRARFYNSIYHAMAVVGVNTTAFLESSALDKPCITIHTKRFGETQRLPHFHHLAEADFLETANGSDQLVDLIGNIKAGVDARSRQRRAFVENFLRPCNPSAVEAYVEVVEEIVRNGNHRNPGQDENDF